MHHQNISEDGSDLSAQTPSWLVLVEKIRTGDPEGLARLYDVFARGVRFFLWRQLGPQDLDDRVHDVFLIITQSIQRGELRQPERLMGYVRTIVRRHVAAQIELAVRARRDTLRTDALASMTDRTPNPERALIARENREVAMRILRGLAPRDREVLIRFYLREQTPGEICSDLGLTETQFRLAKSRAKARFSKLCQRRLGTPNDLVHS